MEYFSLNAAMDKADELSNKENKQYIVFTIDMVKYIVEEKSNKVYKHTVYTTK